MGYDTTFSGAINIEPALNQEEINFLNEFRKNSNLYEKNHRLSFHCQWISYDGTKIEWDGIEKFYDWSEWMEYLIFNFYGDNPQAKETNPEQFSFLQSHTLNGTIEAEGEDDDSWTLIVKNNVVEVIDHNEQYDPDSE